MAENIKNANSGKALYSISLIIASLNYFVQKWEGIVFCKPMYPLLEYEIDKMTPDLKTRSRDQQTKLVRVANHNSKKWDKQTFDILTFNWHFCVISENVGCIRHLLEKP